MCARLRGGITASLSFLRYYQFEIGNIHKATHDNDYVDWEEEE